MKPDVLFWIMVWVWIGTLGAEEGQPVGKYTETVTTKAGKDISFDMVLIPGGQFEMGSPSTEPGRKDDEGPQHPVELDSFYLCSTEVTLELFIAYYRENASAKKKLLTTAYNSDQGIDAVTMPTPIYGDITLGHSRLGPAMGMSWKNAMMVCHWLSEKTGKTYRLPTEAEWEYACRGGVSGSPSPKQDPNQVGEVAWYADNSDKEPHEVGTRQPNALGLYDMMGNVREWVYDFYSPTGYQGLDRSQPVHNPTGPEQGRVHVARGGDHSSPLEEMRPAARACQEPWWQSGDPQLPKSVWWLPHMDFIGFRVARSISSDASD